MKPPGPLPGPCGSSSCDMCAETASADGDGAVGALTAPIQEDCGFANLSAEESKRTDRQRANEPLATVSSGRDAAPVPGGFRPNDTNAHPAKCCHFIDHAVPVIEFDTDAVQKHQARWIRNAPGLMHSCDHIVCHASRRRPKAQPVVGSPVEGDAFRRRDCRHFLWW